MRAWTGAHYANCGYTYYGYTYYGYTYYGHTYYGYTYYGYTYYGYTYYGKWYLLARPRPVSRHTYYYYYCYYYCYYTCWPGPAQSRAMPRRLAPPPALSAPSSPGWGWG